MHLRTHNVDGFSVVAVRGSIDLFTSPSLKEAVSSLMAECPDHIVFDLSGVDFVDLSGLAILLGTATQQRYAKRSVSLVGVGRAVARALEVSDADLPTYGALDELRTLAA